MNVLVTGGSGYIGSHLVGALRQAGHVVRVLDLQPASDQHLADPGCDFIQGSIADVSLVAQAVRDVEVIYHLAWGFYPENEQREMQENLFGTLNLLEAALTAGVRHFLFASTAVVYGPTGPIRVVRTTPATRSGALSAGRSTALASWSARSCAWYTSGGACRSRSSACTASSVRGT